MLKAGSNALLDPLHKLFNQILSQQTFPTSWNYNTLTPLHKKGDLHDPKNYRGIALSSTLSKLFCTVLHNRLTKHIDINSLIPPNQIGYKKGARTADHVLTLKSLVDKYVNKIVKAKLYTCFVDFKKAFDTISRNALFFKLLKIGIGGNFLKTLQCMYKQVYFQIKLPNGLTETISSSTGVKQGCVLSPTLFNLFLSDLPDIFDSTCDPAILHDIPISCLMFADDLVLISQTAAGLQNSINKLGDYCEKWSLHVNLDKTKIVIFNQAGRLLRQHHFKLGNQTIEMTSSYCYLGVVFSSCGSFTRAIERLKDQALKALFKLKQKDIQNHPTTAFTLFDTLILPIIRYCSEIWAPFVIKNLNDHNMYQICDKLPMEIIHTQFCKYI